MPERLPAKVQCCVCPRMVRVDEARREVIAWVLAGKGGSLSNPRGQKFTGRWICRRCEVLQNWPNTKPEGSLLSDPAFPIAAPDGNATHRKLSPEETAAHVARLKAKLA